MKIVKRLVAACRYTTKAGDEKTNWVEMGAMWKTDDGQFRLMVSAVPTINWDGWVMLQDPWEPEKIAEPKQQPKKEVVSDADIPF